MASSVAWEKLVVPHQVSYDGLFHDATKRVSKGTTFAGESFPFFHHVIDTAGLTKGEPLPITKKVGIGFSGDSVDKTLTLTPFSEPYKQDRNLPPIKIRHPRVTGLHASTLYGERQIQRTDLSKEHPIMTRVQASKFLGHDKFLYRYGVPLLNFTVVCLTCLGKFIKWSFVNLFWVLKGLVNYGVSTYHRYTRRQPLELSLPGKIGEENPGWKVQARQLAFEVDQLKGSLGLISRGLHFPVKLAVEWKFNDGSATQTVSSSLLVKDARSWNRLPDFFDSLYSQSAQARGLKVVTSKYKLSTTFIAVSAGGTGENYSVHRRLNEYTDGCGSDAVKQVESATISKEDFPGEIDKTFPEMAAVKWLKQEELAPPVGEALATYTDDNGELTLLS